jgi:hypothetical protein
MTRTHDAKGKFTSIGAVIYGFKKGNKLGKKFGAKEKHWNWRGGYKYYRSGSGRKLYRRIKINGKWTAEHRYVMEQYLGRKLNIKEIVHHKDGDGLNNVISNLEIMSWGQHSAYHLTKEVVISAVH